MRTERERTPDLSAGGPNVRPLYTVTVAEAASVQVARRAGAGSLEFAPVDVPDAPEVLAGILRTRILSGELAEGSSLPPERMLVEQTRLSRATVREALRILQLQGLVVRRVGRAGGSVVARPAAEDVISWLDLFLQGRQLDTSVLLEVRAILEPWCAALAAERRTEADLQELDGCNQHMLDVLDNLDAYLDANVAWHMAVADASHNELLSSLMHALSKAVLRQTGGEHMNTTEVRASAVRAHAHVIESIRAGDAEAARRRMSQHVHTFGAMILALRGQ